MPIINVPANFPPTQVDVVVKGKDAVKPKRSCEGALHLRPGTVFLTKEEMEYLKKTRPEVHKRLQFVALTKEERAEIQTQATSAPTPAPTAMAAKKDEPEAPKDEPARRSRGDKG
jgi:hypothetical protein